MIEGNEKAPPFGLSVTLSLVMLVAAIVAAFVVPAEVGPEPTLAHRLANKFNTTRFVTVTREQAEEQIEGYYEGLFQHSGKAVSVNALVSGHWATDWAAWESARLREGTTNKRGDFLYYDLLPDLDVPESPGRLRTNSFGMADREYPVERTPGKRRVAYIGDSMARGLGSSPGASYEALLEAHLDSVRPAGDSLGFESLNFGVEGYRITQMVEVTHTKAAMFDPDVYLVVLSNLGVSRKWSDHIGQLVADGIDLKYDYLRQVVRRAGLRPDDDAVTMEAKIGPYRMDVLRWALESIRDFATVHGAETVVLLVPTANHGQGDFFEGIPEMVVSLGLPLIDILDTFEGVDDLAPYRISAMDAHPTDLGHRLLYEHLLRALDDNPAARRVLTGEPAP